MARPEQQTEETLTRLLLRWQDAQGEDERAIESEVRVIFEETRAIFVLDMSGFSSSVIKHDIIHFLAKIHQMRSVVVPLLHQHGGEVVKYVADDVIALFPGISGALAASIAVIESTQDEGFPVSIGIGFGPLLHVPGMDIWGAEVNGAFKLGEDTAGPGQVLLTASAFEALPDPEQEHFEPIQIHISGFSFTAYEAVFARGPEDRPG